MCTFLEGYFPLHPHCVPLHACFFVVACLFSSSGKFEGTHIGDWYQDTRAMMTQLLAQQHAGKNIIVGEHNCVTECLQLWH